MLRVANFLLGRGPFFGQRLQPFQHLDIQSPAEQRVDQLAFLFAKVFAPHHSQKLIFLDPIAKANGPRFRVVGFAVAELHHLAGKAGMDPRQMARVDEQRAVELQFSRGDIRHHLGGFHPQLFDHIGRNFDRRHVAGKEFQFGRVVGRGRCVCRAVLPAQQNGKHKNERDNNRDDAGRQQQDPRAGMPGWG